MNGISDFLSAYGGLFLFVIGFAEQSGLPFPGAPWLVAAGALSAADHFPLISVVVWSASGSLAADAIWFYLGQCGKARVFRMFPHLVAVQSRLYRATLSDSVLHGVRMLVAAKFLPLGNVIPLHAGAMEVGLVRFLMVDGLSSIIYVSLFLCLGYAFHDQLEQALLFTRRLGRASLAVGLLAVGVLLVVKTIRSRRSRTKAPGPGSCSREEGGESLDRGDGMAVTPGQRIGRQVQKVIRLITLTPGFGWPTGSAPPDRRPDAWPEWRPSDFRSPTRKLPAAHQKRTENEHEQWMGRAGARPRK